MGAFIRRRANGSGNLSSKDARLKLDYGASGFADTDVIRVKIFGIEMVYVPRDAFYVGDTKSDYTWKQGAADDDPMYINSEDAIRTDGTSYYFTQSVIGTPSFATGADFTIRAEYPKGYAAFYAMKYELTQGQWIDFFNNLLALERDRLLAWTIVVKVKMEKQKWRAESILKQ